MLCMFEFILKIFIKVKRHIYRLGNASRKTYTIYFCSIVIRYFVQKVKPRNLTLFLLHCLCKISVFMTQLQRLGYFSLDYFNLDVLNFPLCLYIHEENFAISIIQRMPGA